MGVKIGIQLHLEFTTPAEVLGAAREAEAEGADSVWLWDHLMPHRRSFGTDGPHLELWTMLVAVAAATEHVSIGPLAANIGVRGNPRVFALAVKTLTDLALGRVRLAFGTGWYEAELRLYDIPAPPRNQKAERLVSWVRDFRQRWEAITSDDVPLALAGSALPIIRSAAAEGLGWNYYGWDSPDPVADFAHRSKLYRELLERTPGQARPEPWVSVLIDEGEVECLPGYVELGANEIVIGIESTRRIAQVLAEARHQSM